MSGGSWEYFYARFDDAVDRLERSPCAVRRAMGIRLRPLVTVFRTIEWVDSHDMGQGEEIEPIKAALGQDGPGLVVTELRKEAERIIKELKEVISGIQSEKQ